MEGEHNPNAVRKNALLGGVVWAVASLIFLIGGWLVPGYLLENDPVIRSDPDFRAGAVLPIAMLLGLIFGGLAAKNFATWYRASDR